MTRTGLGAVGLPAAAAEMYTQLLEAAATGRIDEIVAVAELNELKPAIGSAGAADVAASILALSRSGDGKDVLAAITETLRAPWLAVPQGRDVENAWIYVWPATAARRSTMLSAEEEAALAKLAPPASPVPASPVPLPPPASEPHWSIGIGADGTWHFLRR